MPSALPTLIDSTRDEAVDALARLMGTMTRREILRHAAQHGQVTTTDIEHRLPFMSATDLHQNFRRLLKSGLLINVGPRSGYTGTPQGIYHLTPAAKQAVRDLYAELAVMVSGIDSAEVTHETHE